MTKQEALAFLKKIEQTLANKGVRISRLNNERGNCYIVGTIISFAVDDKEQDEVWDLLKKTRDIAKKEKAWVKLVDFDKENVRIMSIAITFKVNKLQKLDKTS